jgi:hypothetical protein
MLCNCVQKRHSLELVCWPGLLLACLAYCKLSTVWFGTREPLGGRSLSLLDPVYWKDSMMTEGEVSFRPISAMPDNAHHR